VPPGGSAGWGGWEGGGTCPHEFAKLAGDKTREPQEIFREGVFLSSSRALIGQAAGVLHGRTKRGHGPSIAGDAGPIEAEYSGRGLRPSMASGRTRMARGLGPRGLQPKRGKEARAVARMVSGSWRRGGGGGSTGGALTKTQQRCLHGTRGEEKRSSQRLGSLVRFQQRLFTPPNAK